MVFGRSQAEKEMADARAHADMVPSGIGLKRSLDWLKLSTSECSRMRPLASDVP